MQLFLPVNFINRMIEFKIIFEIISDFYHTRINLVAILFIKTGNHSFQHTTNTLSQFIEPNVNEKMAPSYFIGGHHVRDMAMKYIFRHKKIIASKFQLKKEYTSHQNSALNWKNCTNRNNIQPVMINLRLQKR